MRINQELKHSMVAWLIVILTIVLVVAVIASAVACIIRGIVHTDVFALLMGISGVAWLIIWSITLLHKGNNSNP